MRCGSRFAPRFTGDGIPEIAYELGTVGGTVSSPTMFGVSQWTGTTAHRIFDFRNGGDPEPGYAYVGFVVTRIVTGTGGLPEIETRHRWDGTGIAPVPGSVRIEDA